ncbi:DUF6053 domain-containing protein [Lysobacter enzymogenes]|uniref:DUF6053 domain-containing protein n=1 Tax=Lysobacter enzymogenes TaxID=69 RepID=UPI003CCD901D
MGGTSVPTPLCQIAATRPKSIGTEVPPTRAACGGGKSRRKTHRPACRPYRDNAFAVPVALACRGDGLGCTATVARIRSAAPHQPARRPRAGHTSKA